MKVRQPEGRTISELVAAHGIETHTADGNDVETVYTLSKAAVETARNGAGPVFLELSTYRWREHCGPNFDNHIGYRTEEEYAMWRDRDPLALHQKKLIDDGVFTAEELNIMTAELLQEVNAAIQFAQASEFPAQVRAGQHVYAS